MGTAGYECHYHMSDQARPVQKGSLLRSGSGLGTWPEQQFKYEASRQELAMPRVS